MFRKLKEIEQKYEKFESDLSSPEIIQDQKLFQKVAKEHSQLTPIITAFRKYQAIQEEIENNQSLMEDADHEIRKLAKEEIEKLKDELARFENELKILMLPVFPG